MLLSKEIMHLNGLFHYEDVFNDSHNIRTIKFKQVNFNTIIN